MTYRSIPRYANSDLGEFRDLLFSNQAPKPASAAQVVGTQFHAWLLENHEPTGLTPLQTQRVTAMREAVLRHPFARRVLEIAQVEQIQLWEDAQTGLLCKAQTDIWIAKQALLVDIKTTRARGYGEFLGNCEQYAYDRQGAFYLDGTPGASRFVILGVQKMAPYAVYYFEASACRGCIEGGRKKYQGLLRGIARTGFVPSSWQVSPQ